ncbi:glycohydrolase toxin TNT-related protein [Actinokineospora sp.]|uniref:glycohydrolase toxin TNT-related protein n=1 Tax=Actinokineospora sp. TaxID=1872133 RepID=UPI0040378403
MGIELPAELVDAAAAAGVAWPEADEDKLRESAAAWRDAGTRITTLTADADSAARTALNAIDGDTAAAANTHWSRFVQPDTGHLTAAAGGCTAAADRLDHAAEQVGAAKVEIVRNLVALAKNTDAAGQAAAAGHPNALLGLDTAIRGTAVNVTNIKDTLVSAVQPGAGVDVSAVRPVVAANPGDFLGGLLPGGLPHGTASPAVPVDALPGAGDSRGGPLNLIANTVHGVADTATGTVHGVADTVAGDGPRGNLLTNTVQAATGAVQDITDTATGAGHVVRDSVHQVVGGEPAQVAEGNAGTGPIRLPLDAIADLPTPPTGIPAGYSPAPQDAVQAASAAVLDAPAPTQAPAQGGVPVPAQPAAPGAAPSAPAPGAVPPGVPAAAAAAVPGHRPQAGSPAANRPTFGDAAAQPPAEQRGKPAAATSSASGGPPSSARAATPPTPDALANPNPNPDEADDPPTNPALPRPDGPDASLNPALPQPGPDRAINPAFPQPGSPVDPVIGLVLPLGVPAGPQAYGVPHHLPAPAGPAPQSGGQSLPADPPRPAARERDTVMALFLVHMFPIGHLPVAACAPTRQLPQPPPELDYAAGLRFAPDDHPQSWLINATARTEQTEPVHPGTGSALAEGHDPLGGQHERDWDRRFLVRPADPDTQLPTEYAWPPGELYPEGGTAPGEPEVLRTDVVLDRFGTADGRVFAADGTRFAARSLPPAHLDAGYHRYRVLRPLPVWRALSAPWFAQPGGGERYRTTQSAADLVALGYLTEITPGADQ